eukprot:UN29154
MASRGEHFVYMLFCGFWPEYFLYGCQCVQLALWFWAGVAKIGPWFKYVVMQMTPNSPLARLIPGLLHALRDVKTDEPSPFCTLLAWGGCIT